MVHVRILGQVGTQYRLQDVETLEIRDVPKENILNVYRRGLCTIENGSVDRHGVIKFCTPDFIKHLAQHATDDYQHRGRICGYPRKNIPVSIDVHINSIEAEFKNTNEETAREYLRRFLEKYGYKHTKIKSTQTGDYFNDWVQVYTDVIDNIHCISSNKPKEEATCFK